MCKKVEEFYRQCLQTLTYLRKRRAGREWRCLTFVDEEQGGSGGSEGRVCVASHLGASKLGELANDRPERVPADSLKLQAAIDAEGFEEDLVQEAQEERHCYGYQQRHHHCCHRQLHLHGAEAK